MTSKSARALSKALGGKRLLQSGSRYKQRDDHIIVNWGSSQQHPRVNTYDYNQHMFVHRASCKLRTFRQLFADNVPTVSWTTDKATVKGWMRDGASVYCRHTTVGKSGQGIQIIAPERVSHNTIMYPDIPDAPLYTRGLTSWSESRIHMDYTGIVIDWQRKEKRDRSEEDTEVRNHASNYVFYRKVREPAQSAFEVALEAIESLGLHFGAVDVATLADGSSVVLEVNTAPGLTGTTLDNYVSYFKNGENHVRI